MASFGGSLHAPVAAGFVRKLGASTSDIGTMGALISVGMLVCAEIFSGEVAEWLHKKYCYFMGS